MPGEGRGRDHMTVRSRGEPAALSHLDCSNDGGHHANCATVAEEESLPAPEQVRCQLLQNSIETNPRYSQTLNIPLQACQKVGPVLPELDRKGPSRYQDLRHPLVGHTGGPRSSLLIMGVNCSSIYRCARHNIKVDAFVLPNTGYTACQLMSGSEVCEIP